MLKKHLISLLTISAAALFISPAWGELDTTSKITFACENIQDVPITIAKNSEGKTLPIFHWKKEALTTVKTTPQELCLGVTAKLNEYVIEGYDLSELWFTNSQEADLPAICVAEKNFGCDLVLFTLAPVEKPSDAASQALETILDRKLQVSKSYKTATTSMSYSISSSNSLNFGSNNSDDKYDIINSKTISYKVNLFELFQNIEPI